MVLLNVSPVCLSNMPTFRVRRLNCTVSLFLLLLPNNSVSDAHSARIRIPSDVLNIISLVESCLCSDFAENFALCGLEAGQKNV